MFGFVLYEPLKYDQYEYPMWANMVGWMVALSSILCMPTLAIVQFLLTPGTCKQVSRESFNSVTFTSIIPSFLCLFFLILAKKYVR